MSSDEVGQVTLIVSTALAAIAAGAAWVSAYHSRKLARAATLPDLSIQLIVRQVAPGIGRVEAAVHNAGSGVARGVLFALVRDGAWVTGTGPQAGILRPDEMFQIETSIQSRFPADDEAERFAIVACRDREGYSHVWTHTEQHTVLRHRLWWPGRDRRARVGTRVAEYLRRHHGIDTEALDTAGFATSGP